MKAENKIVFLGRIISVKKMRAKIILSIGALRGRYFPEETYQWGVPVEEGFIPVKLVFQLAFERATKRKIDLGQFSTNRALAVFKKCGVLVVNKNKLYIA